MIDFDTKLLVNQLATQSNKVMVKSGFLAMNEKSLEITMNMILKLNNLISMMRDKKETNFESDISILETVVASYESSIDNIKNTIKEETELVKKYSEELESMIDKIKNNIILKDK